MNPEVLAAVRAAYPHSSPSITLGAPLHAGACHPEPLITIPLAMLNRHGLIAGATGTGKTKTLQLLTEQIAGAGVPVFLADLKGDLSGLAVGGEESERVRARAQETGWSWKPVSCSVEFLSLAERAGTQLRATVSSFGPLLLARVLGLNQTQASVLAMVFKYCDDRGLLLLDFADLRTVLRHLTGPGTADLARYGGMSRATVGVLLRELVELEQQGALAFFGEPEFDLDDLLRVADGGQGVVSVLELADIQDRPALFSTFMMWMLARLYATLPEVGDLQKPKLVFFFDEAHLLFRNAGKEFLEQVQQVVRLIRSKGVGVFFVTQSPKDIPPEVLGQLGNRIQHALRAFTPDDEKALRAAARTLPVTAFCDVEETLTTLGIGEALVSVLSTSGVPTPPFATRLVPPGSRMEPLSEADLTRFSDTAQARRYAQPVNRVSAHEQLAPGAERAAPARDAEARSTPQRRDSPGEPPSTLERILQSPLARTVAGEVTRGLMGALFGSPRRRRR